MKRLLTYGYALLVFLVCFSAWGAPAGQNVISSCGENLGAFIPDAQQFTMPDEQVNLLLQENFHGLPLVTVNEIDAALSATGDMLFHIEADIEMVNAMLKGQESNEYLKSRKLQLNRDHEFQAIILVALKTRRARIFRSIDN